jgi:toxin-antitoxin system PIN domain toxin
MILLDINALVYAHREDINEHPDYAAWVTEVAEGDEPFVLGAATVAGFVRVVTNPKVFNVPSTPDAAVGFVNALTESPRCRWVEPGERWWPLFAELCRRGRIRGNLVPDAQLAAIAIEHGCRLATADQGFARFTGLRWFHPLEP